MPKQHQDPKPKPAPKSELILDAALEAQYFRNSSLGVPMVLIPNHPSCKAPVALLDNFDFACWLTWRCYKKHGFIATTALINATIRFLTGLALYDEATPAWDAETKQIAELKPITRSENPQQQRIEVAKQILQTAPLANAAPMSKAGATP